MPTARTPWWNSIVTRISVIIAVFVVLSTLLAGLLVYRGAREQMMTAAGNDMRRSLQLARLRLSAFATTMADDARFLASNDAARSLAAAMDTTDSAAMASATGRMAVLMESFIQNRPYYAQVRVLGADSAGMELIRFDRSPAGVMRVGSMDLQAKGDRDYYRAAMRLPPGALYYSPIDLNREHGRVQQPIMPTVRAAVGLFAPSGHRVGIAIINADLRPLFAEVQALQGPHESILLANARGEVLLHPDTARAFQFEWGASHTLADEAGGGIHLDTTWIGGGRMLRFEQAGIDVLQYAYTLGIATSLDGLLAGIGRQRDRSVLISLAVAALFILFSIFLSGGMAARLARVTRRVERYAAGERGERLPLERRDEIGRLARSVEQMQERIDQRVRELEEARGRAETADRMRREFLANMSHEVRTPLNAILGMLGEVDRDRLGIADRERLDIVHRSAQRLKGLVDDLLLHARIGEGRLELKPAWTDLRQVLSDIAQSHRSAAEAKGIALRASVEGGTWMAWVDPLRLHQIADNLVGNAVKYTLHGQVDVKTWIEETQGARLHLRVNDTGPGLSPEDQARIFERFERATSVGNDAGGSGLGLAITQRLVRIMGGAIQVESTPGAGSTFTVALPLAAPVAEGPVLPAVDPAVVQDLRVLYVEDVESNRMVMEQWAARLGWRLDLADRSAAAIERAASTGYDLVLLDLDLGEDMRGTELGLRLRGLKRHRFTPMLAVTAFVAAEEEAEILKAGINDRITKPVDRNELVARAAFWCGRDRGPCAGDVRLDALEAQYDRDPVRLITVMQQYRREFTQWRLTLRAAVEKNDRETIGRVRHKLEPHLRLLGLDASIAAKEEASGPAGPSMVEDVFRCCDRALMARQRELQDVAAGAVGQGLKAGPAA